MDTASKQPAQADAPGPTRHSDERELRWGRVRKFMDERGLEALIAFGDERIRADHYLMNHTTTAPHVIFPREGKITCIVWAPLVVAQHMMCIERGEDPWVEDVRAGMGGRQLAAVIREKGLENKTIGVIGMGACGPLLGSGWANYQTMTALKEALPDAILQNVTSDFGLLMLERSPVEIDHARRASDAGEEACKAMMEVIKPGANEAEVYAAGMHALLKRGVFTSWMILQSGPDNTGWGAPMWLHRAQPPRVLQAGDVVGAEIFPQYGGVDGHLQLAVAIGDIRPVYEVCAKAARNSYEAGLAAIKPGVTFAEVCEAMEQPVREVAGWHLTPLIHSTNPNLLMGSHAMDIEKHIPEIAERYVGVQGFPMSGGEVVLKPGMIFGMEPNVQLGRARVNIGGSVVVTQSGAEELNQIPNYMQRVPAR